MMGREARMGERGTERKEETGNVLPAPSEEQWEREIGYGRNLSLKETFASVYTLEPWTGQGTARVHLRMFSGPSHIEKQHLVLRP